MNQLSRTHKRSREEDNESSKKELENQMMQIDEKDEGEGIRTSTTAEERLECHKI